MAVRLFELGRIYFCHSGLAGNIVGNLVCCLIFLLNHLCEENQDGI